MPRPYQRHPQRANRESQPAPQRDGVLTEGRKARRPKFRGEQKVSHVEHRDPKDPRVSVQAPSLPAWSTAGLRRSRPAGPAGLQHFSIPTCHAVTSRRLVRRRPCEGGSPAEADPPLRLLRLFAATHPNSPDLRGSARSAEKLSSHPLPMRHPWGKLEVTKLRFVPRINSTPEICVDLRDLRATPNPTCHAVSPVKADPHSCLFVFIHGSPPPAPSPRPCYQAVDNR